MDLTVNKQKTLSLNKSNYGLHSKTQTITSCDSQQAIPKRSHFFNFLNFFEIF